MTDICTTQDTAFVEYGIPSGTTLVTRTYYRLAESGVAVAPTSAFLDRLRRAFETAYIHSADVPLVPDPVDAAIADAERVMAHRLLDAPDRDLRTEVVPEYYRLVARFACEYRARYGDGDVGVYFAIDGR